MVEDMPIVDLHFNGNNLYIVDEQKLSIIHQTHHYLLYENCYKEYISKHFNKDFNGINPNYAIEDEDLKYEILSMTYLTSNMQIISQESILLQIFVNIRLKIAGQFGPRPGNKLAIFRIEARENGLDESVSFVEILSDKDENLLDTVAEAQVVDDFLFMTNKGQTVICNYQDC